MFHSTLQFLHLGAEYHSETESIDMSQRRDKPFLMLMGSREEASFPSPKAENHPKQNGKEGCSSFPLEEGSGLADVTVGDPRSLDPHHRQSHSLPLLPLPGEGEREALPCPSSPIQQAGRGDKQKVLPNDGQGLEVLVGAPGPPQGLVWLAEVDGPQGSAFWAAGPELGRESIKSNRVVCCE